MITHAPVLGGSTDYSCLIRVIDSTDGTPETGFDHATSGIDLWYRRGARGAVTSITEAALAAPDSAHSDGGVEQVGNGYVRVDLPDAAVAAGVECVQVGGTATGMVVIGALIPIVAYNGADGVRLGLTALPNAAADAAGGLPISDAGGLDLDSKLANTNEVTAARMGALTDWINGGRLDLILDDVLADTAVIGAAGAGLTEAGGTGDHLTAVPWNAAWDAEVESEVADGLGVYDPPTNAEMEARTIVAANYATAAALDAVDNFLDTEVADILVDTSTTLDDMVDDLESRLTAALATALQAHGLGIGRGVMAAGSTTTALVFGTVNGAAPSAVDDFYNGRHIIFTSGALTLQATSISDYTGATTTATVPAVTGAPAESVTFIIV